MSEGQYQNKETGLEIAVIGMSVRFPKAKNLDEFWDNLKNGAESVAFFTDQELEEAGVESKALQKENYIPAKVFLEDIEYFDASFFGYLPIEAEIMDPQVRVFHECAWEALENAGYDPETYKGLIGVYAGASSHLKWEVLSLMSGRTEVLGGFASWQLYDKDFLSTRVSYCLNLRGPSVNIQTACSTSLVAIHLASQALLSGECHMALAGGVTLTLPIKSGYFYLESMIYSSDGHCRPFDARSNGTIGGKGVGVVVLKALENAREDGDVIHAIIKSTAVNNDGRNKVGYMAPSVKGQVGVIRSALRAAQVEPGTISYVETHGTGTPLGDPTEIEALKQAFTTNKRNFCRIGSIKSNLGHTDSAAGVAGFIKTVLVLKHKQIPPSLHFEEPNPKIDFDNSPFIVNAKLYELKNDQSRFPLRAGVSSFGIGGTNAHIILEEASKHDQSRGTISTPSRTHQLILLSARTQTALNQVSRNLKEFLTAHPGVNFADAAYTLKVGRKAFEHRLAMVSSDQNEAIDILGAEENATGLDFGKVHSSVVNTDKSNRAVIFMFPGQGAQYVNMGLDLYSQEPVFREEMDRCFDILKAIMMDDSKDILYPPHAGTDRINQTEITQPLIFAFEYALTKLLMKWGIKPYAMIGHSIGEYTAACLSGVFSLEDALKLVVLRGKLMQQMPAGAMLSVPLAEEDLQPLLSDDISLAAVNSSFLCTVSGTHTAIAVFEQKLKEMGCDCHRLHTSHAFHSKMMDPIVEEFEKEVARIALEKPEIPYISNVSGKWIKVEDAANPRYWAKHLRETVQFAAGLKELLKEEDSICLEVGPGKTLSTLVREHHGKKPGHVIIDLVRHPKKEIPDDCFLLSKIGQLWLYGITIDWKEFYSREKRIRVSLPGYPFERQYFPLAGDPLKMGVEQLSVDTLPGKKASLSDWFYIPSWEDSLLPAAGHSEDNEPKSGWLVFADESGLGVSVAERLKDMGEDVVIVWQGPIFRKVAEGEYTVNTEQEDDYNALFTEIFKMSSPPNNIVHLWNVTEINNKGISLELTDKSQESGFYSLVNIAREIGNHPLDGQVRITVLSNNMQEVYGEEVLCPEKATILGPVRVMPREYSNISCQSIDILLPEPGSAHYQRLLDQLMNELTGNSSNQVIAFRGKHRLVQSYKRVHLADQQGLIPRLKEGGVYFITGGLGGIGLVLAEHLAKNKRAKLILTGRSSFPACEDWHMWLSIHGEDNSVSRDIRKLQEMEKTGAEILITRADVSNLSEMQKAVEQAEERFGQVNGVIHAAGVAGGGVISVRTREMSEEELAAKVKGTLVLDTIFANRKLDFVILCSSLNAFWPTVGQVGYSAANAFLDAYADYKTSVNGSLVVSINWDAWKEVGMAQRLLKRFGAKAGTVSPQHPRLDHWLFDQSFTDENGQITFISNFSVKKHWFLDEHRLLGRATVPGVAWLEVARAAFEVHTGNGTLEIRNLYFLTPLVIGEDEIKEVRTTLKEQGDNYEFVVISRSGKGEDIWAEHARGKLLPLSTDETIGKKHNIEDLEALCNEKVIPRPKDRGVAKSKVFRFGPRWNSTNWLRLGKDQGMYEIELPGKFCDDIETYKLHPGLMDVAVGVPVVGSREFFLPFSYKSVKVKGELPRKIFSHFRYVDNEDSRRKAQKCDFLIMDDQGRELVVIEEYTKLAVSKERQEQHANPDETRKQNNTPASEEFRSEILKYGILNSEGIDVFQRILRGVSSRVAVSTINLELRMKLENQSRQSYSSAKTEKVNRSKQKNPRPQLNTEYIQPGSQMETIIANIWQEVLRLEKVGIYDDYFELGGNSFNIVKVNNKLQENLKKEIPIGVMFSYSTISELAGYLEQGLNKKKKKEEIENLQKSKEMMLQTVQKTRQKFGGKNE